MKTLLIVGILLVGISGQALSMGHPHNMFAARKQLRAKTSTSVVRAKTSVSLNLQHTVQVAKTTFGDRLIAVLSHVRPTQAY
ncbi:hypothetical protein BH09BAC4_BH09BAC4_40960 [soil metagenome]